MTHFSCGIDFGTTNSTIGILKNNQPQMVQLENDSVSMPTALFFEDKKKKPLYGKHAVDCYVNGTDGRFIRSIKRILGSDLMDKFTVINGKGVRFDDLIGLFLSRLKQTAESQIDSTIDTAVIGRPVHFQDNDVQADQKAEDRLKSIAQKIGFKHVSFQYEPIAAAFAHEQLLTSEKLALVVDIGGGTSDFTIIRIGPNLSQKVNRADDILATTGVRIGGNDLDKALNLNFFMPSFGKGSMYGAKSLICPNYLFADLSEWSLINFCYTPQNIQRVEDILLTAHEPIKIQRLLDLLEFQEAHRLLKLAEDAKIDLTKNHTTQQRFDNFNSVILFDVSQNDFEKVIAYDVEKIERCMKECLTQAHLSADKIDLLILTGGSCEVPYVQKAFRRLFPTAQFSDKEKMLSVGYGLTYATHYIE